MSQSCWLPTFRDWSVASCRTAQKCVDTRTDQAMKETTRTPGRHPREKEVQLPLATKRYSRASLGIAPRRGAPKTPVREGEETQTPSRRGANGCCRLSLQLLICGQDIQRGESVGNAFSLADHLDLCAAWRLAPSTCKSSVYRELRIRCWRLDQSWKTVCPLIAAR